MSRESLSLSEQYVAKTFAVEDEDLSRVRKGLQDDGKFGINVSAGEGKLLHFIVGLLKPKLLIEIGTLYGYSTLWMAKALPEGSRLISIEYSAENYQRASSLIVNSKVADKIKLIQGDAKTILPTIEEKPDMIFIDADKGGYRDYLDWAMSAVRVGGVIIGDNTFLFGHLIGEDRGEKVSKTAIESMTYFNETLARSANFRSAMIPTFEGMTIAERLS